MQCTNCDRGVESGVIRAGQRTANGLRVPPRWEASSFIPLYGVLPAQAHPAWYMLSALAVPRASRPPISFIAWMCICTVDGMPFWASSSLIVPFCPSPDDPLSPQMYMIRVLSPYPSASISSMTRPACTSACSPKPAAISINRVWNSRSSSGMSSHAGIRASRSVSSADSGIQFFALARAKTRSRYSSQPPSNRPEYLSPTPS